jgi:hypothetical protein
MESNQVRRLSSMKELIENKADALERGATLSSFLDISCTCLLYPRLEKL